MPLLVGSLWLFTRGNGQFENNADVINKLIPGLCAALFVCCMVCHGELARRKPHPRYLTQFYLMVSVGGAMGGLFVALVAPRICSIAITEMPIAVAGCALLAAIALWDDESGVGRSGLRAGPSRCAVEYRAVPLAARGCMRWPASRWARCTGFLARSVMWRHAFMLAAAAGLTGYLGRRRSTTSVTTALPSAISTAFCACATIRPTPARTSRRAHADPRHHQSRHRAQ